MCIWMRAFESGKLRPTWSFWRRYPSPSSSPQECGCEARSARSFAAVGRSTAHWSWWAFRWFSQSGRACCQNVQDTFRIQSAEQPGVGCRRHTTFHQVIRHSVTHMCLWAWMMALTSSEFTMLSILLQNTPEAEGSTIMTNQLSTQTWVEKPAYNMKHISHLSLLPA